jgi:hypothetical protein
MEADSQEEGVCVFRRIVDPLDGSQRTLGVIKRLPRLIDADI